MTGADHQPLLGTAAYNPGQLLNAEELKEQFVVRLTLMEELLEHLRGSESQARDRHLWLYGRSGMGKTILLWRLRYAIEDDPGLRQTHSGSDSSKFAVLADSRAVIQCSGSLSQADPNAGSLQSVNPAELFHASSKWLCL